MCGTRQFRRPAHGRPLLSEPPQHLRSAEAATKGAHLRWCLGTFAAGTLEEQEQAWFNILLFDKLVFHIGGSKSEGLNAKFRARLRAVDDGEWLHLVWDLFTVC
mmetsp:Transcript_26729/g.86554  ORF Transcript_26729/g.86554 Transcript_26729/m.86554 type:complete len:104 (-) Transcript_26729:1427-1738(-)